VGIHEQKERPAMEPTGYTVISDHLDTAPLLSIADAYQLAATIDDAIVTPIFDIRPVVDTTSDDICGPCGQSYSEHCPECFNCKNAHDEYCGW
jgi:hypothetical protein